MPLERVADLGRWLHEVGEHMVRGLWVIAGSFDSDEVTEFDVSPIEAVEGEHGARDGRRFFADAVPSVTEVRIDFDGDGPAGRFGFDRQAR